jgi:hypothetical protein
MWTMRIDGGRGLVHVVRMAGGPALFQLARRVARTGHGVKLTAPSGVTMRFPPA